MALSRPRQKTQDRLAAYHFGRLAELRTMLYLTLRGYRILGWRYRTPVGEIDIVARKPGLLVLVEVKARRSHDTARASLSPHQQSRLKRAADYLRSSRPRHASDAIRFDCCTVTWYMRLNHLTNVF